MKLSEDTIAILKNFATINSNLVFKPGQKLKTIAESKTIMAQADIIEDFPQEVGLYDLNEFLSVLSMIPEPDIQFLENNLHIVNNLQQVDYFYSNPEILTTPGKDIQMPDAEVGISLSEEELKRIHQASSVLGHSDLSIVRESNDKVFAKVFDAKDATANVYTLSLVLENQIPNRFNFDFNIANLKLLPGDYFVSLSSAKISNWTNANYPVEYFIALENTTEFHA